MEGNKLKCEHCDSYFHIICAYLHGEYLNVDDYREEN